MEFEPIILRYDGLVADQHLIDLGQVGQSLQGAAQLLGIAGTIATTGEYAKRTHALSVRVYAGIPSHGCWELPAFIVSVLPAGTPQFSAVVDMGKKLATRAVVAFVNYAIAANAEKTSDVDRAMDTVDKAVAELGFTSRHAIDAVTRMAGNNRPAVRMLVTPVGSACEFMRVGSLESGAIQIGREMRAEIDAPEQTVIGGTSQYEIFVSEIDVVNGSCKFSFRDDPEHRIPGEITDPLVKVPTNPYSQAVDAQKWIAVTAKPEMQDGEIIKLFISDVVQS